VTYSGIVYLKKSQLIEKYSISPRQVDRVVQRIRAETGKRYPAGSITDCGRIIRIREDVFTDMMTYGNAINCGIAPPFKEGRKQ
jgi:transcriptional regulator CtsR